MDLIQLYSTVSSIFFILLSTNYNPTSISAQSNIEVNVKLMDFFQNAKNSFDTVHVLTQIRRGCLDFICALFTRKDVKVYPDLVDLVYFDPRAFTNHPSSTLERSSPIPIFICQIHNRPKFYVTYAKGNKVYQLLKSRQGEIRSTDPTVNHVKIMVEAIDSRIIDPRLLKINTSVEDGVVQYFKSEEYLKQAEEILDDLGGKVLHLCKIFSLQIDDPLAVRSNYKYETSTAPLIIHGKEIGPVPNIKCHPTGIGNDTSSFNIFHYYKFIFFKTNNNDGENNYEMVSYLPTAEEL